MSERSGKKSTQYKNRYNASNYDSLRIVIPKGRKAIVEAFAVEQGKSVNGLVNGLLRGAVGLTEDEWKKLSDKDDPDYARGGMSMNYINKSSEQTFEHIKHVNEYSQEFWYQMSTQEREEWVSQCATRR